MGSEMCSHEGCKSLCAMKCRLMEVAYDCKSEHDKSPEEKFESYQKSVKDIWSSATPELRAKMRTTLTELVNDMA